MTVNITGQCPRCSWRDHLVFHGTTWCPHVPALGWVDWNAADTLGAPRGYTRRTHHISDRNLSRPVDLDEVMLIYSIDGDYMATWVRIVEVHSNGSVGVVEIGCEGPDDNITYAEAEDS